MTWQTLATISSSAIASNQWVVLSRETTAENFRLKFTGNYDNGEAILIRRLLEGGEVTKATKVYAKVYYSLIQDFGIPDFLLNAGFFRSVLMVRRDVYPVRQPRFLYGVEIDEWV